MNVSHMLFQRNVKALPVILLSLVSLAQGQGKPPAAGAFSQEALVIERSETTLRMHADGTGDRDVHVVVRIQSDGAAQQFGVLTFAYASAYETPVIKYVRVRKPDGTTVDTPPSAAIDMPADVTREAPLYSDLKEKHLPVRSLAAGDTLEYDVDTVINKAEAPGQFWGTMHFTPPGTVVVLAEILRLEVPADKYVQVWSPNHKPEVSEANGVRTYSWNVAQLVTAPKSTGEDGNKPVPPKDPDEDTDGRKLPSVAWTTFHSWAEVGDWYRSLALAQAAPNDTLRARAAELTKDSKTPEEQVRAIYNYVSTQTRYVGIDFGIGRYQPHAAAEVLADQYGDCKDKDTLLEGLLRARGFVTAPALVGVGIAPVPEVPSPAVFNHVITTVTLAGGRIWLDSTPPAAPYRYLSAAIREQKALVVPAENPATLVTTPAEAPYPFFADFDGRGTLDTEGKLTAKITARYRDDDEVIVRSLARSVAPADWDKASQYISSATGFGGTTSSTQFSNVDNTAQPIVMTYDYTRNPYGDWGSKRIVPLMPALEFTALDNDSIEPQDDIQLGAPRTMTATCHIKLPDGYTPDLPDAIHVKTDFATFDKTYAFKNGEIVVERNIVVLKRKLPRSDWKAYQRFTKDISLQSESWIQLIETRRTLTVESAPGTASQAKGAQTTTVLTGPAAGGSAQTSQANAPESGTASKLLQQAQQKMREQDWSGAEELLDQVKAKNPEEPNLWSGYGIIALLRDKDYDAAKADFSKELSLHPDSEAAAGSLAEVEVKSGDTDGARKTLRQYLNLHPADVRMSLYLAYLARGAGDYADALRTLQTAAKHNADNREVQLQMSDALFHLGRMEEAAAAAKSVLDGADDPELLNDGAYDLSETGIDLDVAENAAQRSVAKLEEKSAAMTTEQANSQAFAQANLLMAAWDTLGWIYFREGKLDAARPLITAAWLDSLQAEVGDHLGQLYEALGDKNEAGATYALAQAALNSAVTPDVRRHILDSLARLKVAAPQLGSLNGTEALRKLRTYKILRPADVSGWGTFRLEITAAGVIEAQQMTGEQKIAGIGKSLNGMKCPGLVPPDSKAHLLRSAVVSCSLSKECEVVLVPGAGLQTGQ